MDAPRRNAPWFALVRWIALAGLSALLSWLLTQAGVPAALLIGPLLAGIALAASGKPVTVPRPFFLISQAVVGCLIARNLKPELLVAIGQEWPIFLGVSLLIFTSSFALGYVLTRTGAVPGNAAIWGAAPGGAAPMVILAEAYGADARMVAVITYMRVLVVVAVASIILTSVTGSHTGLAVTSAFWKPVAPRELGMTFAVAFGGAILGIALRIPAGSMIGALVIGAVLGWATGIDLATPVPLLAIAYAFIGWRIGLTFSREALAGSARSLPWIILSALTLVALCAGFGGLLAWQLDIDPVTAYLATSPGGLDSIAIMAVSTHSDTSLVMSLQTMRFLIALMLGPRVATFVSKIIYKQVDRDNLSRPR